MTSLLIKAIESDDFETALKLIGENKKNIINMQDSEENTPLHLATNYSLYHDLSPNVRKKLYQIAIALLEKGANPNQKDKWGSLPIHYAAIHGDLELIKKLAEFGADLNAKDGAKETPLHQAIRRKHDKVVHYLLSNPECDFAKTEQGESPIDYAKRYHNILTQSISEKSERQSGRFI
jgi:uncharacterized protein